MRKVVETEMQQLQDFICTALEKIDGKASFSEDKWSREEGGGGRTRTIVNGAIVEKGGVAFSAVHGPVSNAMQEQLDLDGKEFFATGVSIVLHPHNPHIPIIHMNVRYFELDTGVYWFGGGIDLTPHYIVEEHAGSFHQQLKNKCDKFHSEFYPKFKKWADDYFFLPHRNETRGVGGIFYDKLDASCGVEKEKLLDFSMELGKLFPELYEEQVQLGKSKKVTEQNIRWRDLRRGRYVEFNLVHDRGTKFGLLSGGRTESILMSLPPDASWEYMHSTQANSPEERTQNLLKKEIDWASC